MKYCTDLAKLVPNLVTCCPACHKHGNAEFEVIEYQGEQYQVCCLVDVDMEERGASPQR